MNPPISYLNQPDSESSSCCRNQSKKVGDMLDFRPPSAPKREVCPAMPDQAGPFTAPSLGAPTFPYFTFCALALLDCLRLLE
jgi:hypothetical protein